MKLLSVTRVEYWCMKVSLSYKIFPFSFIPLFLLFIAGCYGVTESGSISSTASSSSTEPWFCEPCQGNVVDPPCQLCPNLGKRPEVDYPTIQ